MTKKSVPYLYIVILPFIVSAALEFLPKWVSLPITFLGVLFWAGACAMLLERE